MIDTHEMDELARRLVALGDALAFDHAHMVDGVLARVEASQPHSIRRRWLAVAAILAVVLAGVALYPDSRHAVARWLGLEGVSIEVDPELTSLPLPTSFEIPGPGDSQVFEVNGTRILVSTLGGRLDGTLIDKAVASSDQIEVVAVNGQPGLWISGGAHEVRYEAPGGIMVERVAANTLLWQHDGVLSRVEGFDELSEALAFAAGT